MNPGIFYLYEYKNHQKYRNVGFLKLTLQNHSHALQIHARGIPVTSQDTLKLFAFYLENETTRASLLSEFTCDSRSASARLNLTGASLPAQHTLNDILGFLLLLPNGGILAASMPGIDLDPQSIPFDLIEADSETSVQEPETPVEQPVRTRNTDTISDVQHTQIAAESVDLCSADSSTAPAEPTSDAPESDTPESDAPESDAPDESIKKIQRSEMSALPRRYWNLANNSFLLHGYNNYNHLLLVEKDGHYWLGVPGIYDTREARAAELFGFPQFTDSYNQKLSLSDDECNEHAAFGYWCRYLK